MNSKTRRNHLSQQDNSVEPRIMLSAASVEFGGSAKEISGTTALQVASVDTQSGQKQTQSVVATAAPQVSSFVNTQNEQVPTGAIEFSEFSRTNYQSIDALPDVVYLPAAETEFLSNMNERSVESGVESATAINYDDEGNAEDVGIEVTSATPTSFTAPLPPGGVDVIVHSHPTSPDADGINPNGQYVEGNVFADIEFTGVDQEDGFALAPSPQDVVLGSKIGGQTQLVQSGSDTTFATQPTEEARTLANSIATNQVVLGGATVEEALEFTEADLIRQFGEAEIQQTEDSIEALQAQVESGDDITLDQIEDVEIDSAAAGAEAIGSGIYEGATGQASGGTLLRRVEVDN